MLNYFYSLPLRSPEIITKISSQKNLEYQTNEKNFAKVIKN